MTANMMRMQLAGFEPTEQEFLELFKKRKAYDDEFGIPGMTALSKTEKEKADAAKKELDAQVKASLGDSRYADYERAQDFNFQSIYRVADKNGRKSRRRTRRNVNGTTPQPKDPGGDGMLSGLFGSLSGGMDGGKP